MNIFVKIKEVKKNLRYFQLPKVKWEMKGAAYDTSNKFSSTTNLDHLEMFFEEQGSWIQDAIWFQVGD